MNKLESLRLEVDSRRRTVGRLGKKVRRQDGGVLQRDEREARQASVVCLQCCSTRWAASPLLGF